MRVARPCPADMALRRLDDYGKYLTRPRAHKFTNEEFKSTVEDEYDDGDLGPNTPFPTADQAGWTITPPAPASPIEVTWKPGDFIYMVGMLKGKDKKKPDHVDEPAGATGCFAEIGEVINFYVDPCKATETIWLKYQPMCRQQFTPGTVFKSGVEPVEFVEHELFATEQEAFMRLKWIEAQPITIVRSIDEYEASPHTYLLRYQMDAEKNLSPMHVPTAEPDTAEMEDVAAPAGPEEAAAAEDGAVDGGAAIGGAADGDAADGDAGDGGAGGAAAQGDAAAGVGAPRRRRSAINELDQLRPLVQRQADEIRLLQQSVRTMQESAAQQAEQIARLLSTVGLAATLEPRMHEAEARLQDVETMRADMRQLRAKVDTLESEM